MRSFKKKIKYLLVIIIPALFFTQRVELLFKHAHISEDGTIIYHSHPFNKKENAPENHNHTKSEFIFLSSLDFHYFKVSGALFIKDIFSNHVIKYYNRFDITYYYTIIRNLTPRAPPTISNF